MYGCLVCVWDKVGDVVRRCDVCDVMCVGV